MALPQWELILRLLVASVLGSLIGFERARAVRAAGLRTHMLVCVGSCLIMIVSAYGFAGVLGPHVILDPSRVAAQVVSGVGFLGAGSIILRKEAVRGLTTAASIWTTAGIGLAAGAGLYTAAVASTAIILIILAGLKPIESHFDATRGSLVLRLQARRGEATLSAFEKALARRPTRVKQLVVERGGDVDRDDLVLVLGRAPPGESAEIIRVLEGLPFVLRVSENPPDAEGE